ncbi:hypothetical protein FD32_GL000997 [Limosilactobacillus panis DSM 6035]|uniref:Transposase putative helix-turn-helix domain-containing protein n=1 Tax=Limosilactobacillus panis DSM 6035 TaxID=1423782 RepID=A0A0R1X5U2_9LACO|nr:hypothetical protein FD32_GL000997 [Limosilactobacillus panis DSM 6035]
MSLTESGVQVLISFVDWPMMKDCGEMAQVIKGIKLRLYPNAQQREQLWQMFGNDCFV